MKKERGITLIALIITIIILLILAMVTIRILMNQGIIKHAQNATTAYNDAQNNETEYLTYAEGEMDKYAGATGGSGGAGGDTYTPPAEDVDALKKYFMGTKEDGSINEEGQNMMNILDTEKQDSKGLWGMYGFKDDENTIGSADNIEWKGSYTTDRNGIVYSYDYIKYNDEDMYRIEIEYSTLNVKNVVFVYRPQGAEGETREYKGEQWTVLYDKGDTLELVSPEVIGRYTIGATDTNSVGSTDLEKAIDSYNNAVINLNNYCRTTLKDDTARCVGSNSSHPDEDNPGMHMSEKMKQWLDGKYNGKGKMTDENGEQDFVRMIYHGANVEKNDNSCWLASRVVTESPEYNLVSFSIRTIQSGGAAGMHEIWGGKFDEDAKTQRYGSTNYVRAVVTVDK